MGERENGVRIVSRGILIGNGFEVFLVVVLDCHHGWYGRVDRCGVNEH
jgi:hypothetical protein